MKSFKGILPKIKRRDTKASQPRSTPPQPQAPTESPATLYIPANDEERINRLVNYRVLDSEPEKAFDDFTELVSVICKVPVAMVSLVDKERVWFKSAFGMSGQKEVPRSLAICAHTIMENDVLVVDNLLEDQRFRQYPMVAGGPKLRFYAGAPLVTPDGFAIGSICALDYVPRSFDEDQKKALEVLSRKVVAQLELHKQAEELKELVLELQESRQRIEEARLQAETASISSFENLLLSPAGLEAFGAFLQEEFCCENLMFWKEARDYRDSFTSLGEAEAAALASRVFEVFIALGGPKQVNLVDRTYRVLDASIKKSRAERLMFEEARAEVFALMKKDSYTKFLGSEQYKHLSEAVKHVGVARLKAAETERQPRQPLP